MDFCIGLIKVTKWNTEPKPTIYIYSHKAEKIYPIWRASKIGINLVDFEIDTTDGLSGIKIIDNPYKNIYNISLYRWNSFGLKFVSVIYQNLDSANACNLLRREK
ncbi:MAG: hypothetical protein QG635_195 [Bacteroidota bacterium]|nr:hypothetical protein [Bacteroidota bacterium]